MARRTNLNTLGVIGEILMTLVAVAIVSWQKASSDAVSLSTGPGWEYE
jgi:hypothetical protein